MFRLETQLNNTSNKASLLSENNDYLSNTLILLVDSQEGILYQNSDLYIDSNHIEPIQSNGIFTSTRYDASIRAFVYFHAVLLNDSSILYTMTLLPNVTDQLKTLILSSLAILFFLIFTSVPLAFNLGNYVLRPIFSANEEVEKFIKNKDHVLSVPAEELSPMMNKIVALNNQIDRSLSALNAEQATRQALIENISEGLILLDERHRIISINNSAKNVLFLNRHMQYEGRDIFELIQLQNLKKSLERAIAGNVATTFEDKVQDRYYKYFISPSEQDGFLIFIVDTTKETKENLIRRDFASNVTHELKTPLTSIKGFAEMLRHGMLTEPEDIQKTAAIIYRESNRLLFLIEDTMRLSKIENTDSETDFEFMDLSPTISEVIEALNVIAKEKNISLVYEKAPAKVYANRMMMYELFFNLIENAIKYNVDNGSVTVQTSNDTKECLIAITDTGIGISRDHLSRIFERFYRVDKSRSRDTGGTGLGLSIVKHIVERHGGHIDLTSTKNSGTTVHIRLPSFPK